jgi:hypothetical protein
VVWFRRQPDVPWSAPPVHLSSKNGVECGARLWSGDDNTPAGERQAIAEYSHHIWRVTCQECRIAFRLRGWQGHVHARVGLDAGRPYCGAEPSEVSLVPPETAIYFYAHKITCPQCLQGLEEARRQEEEEARERERRIFRGRWAQEDRERGWTD